MIRLLDIVFFCRPMLLIPVWTIFILLSDRLNRHQGLDLSATLDLLFLTFIVAGGHVVNQIYDRQSDLDNSKLGFFYPPISFTVGAAWTLGIVLTLTAIAYSAIWRPGVLAPFVLAAAVGWAYSAPPLRAKDRPLWGFVFNALSYSVIIGWAVLVSGKPGAVDSRVTDLLNALGLDSGVALTYWEIGAVFFAVGATYLLTTIPDVVGDRSAGKRTLAVVYGIKLTLIWTLLALAVSLGLAWMEGFYSFLVASAVAIPLSALCLWRPSPKLVLLAAKAPIVVVLVFACMAEPYYTVFLLALLAVTRLYYRRRFSLTYPKLT